MTQAQENLLAFLKHWLAWAESGIEEDRTYSREVGLCIAIHSFLEPGKADAGCVELLNSLLKKTKGATERNGELFPFGGRYIYMMDRRDGTAHLNPARLAWVRKTIQELEP